MYIQKIRTELQYTKDFATLPQALICWNRAVPVCRQITPGCTAVVHTTCRQSNYMQSCQWHCDSCSRWPRSVLNVLYWRRVCVTDC